MPAIDRQEVLRYLGYRGQELSIELSALIDECMDACIRTATPRKVTRRFSCKVDETGVQIEEIDLLLPGRDIGAHLQHSGACVLMAATLGLGVDNFIKRLENTDLTRSLILDACATALIESVCDAAEDEVRKEAEAAGMKITSRFSPGYGDLPLELQPRLIAVLDTPRRIGLFCSETHILIPRKSVTAIIGIRPEGDEECRPRRGCGRRCADCRLTGCLYRKEEARHEDS